MPAAERIAVSAAEGARVPGAHKAAARRQSLESLPDESPAPRRRKPRKASRLRFQVKLLRKINWALSDTMATSELTTRSIPRRGVGWGTRIVSAGYTRTLSGAYGNPLGGRHAWSGISGGFITTVVNLPAAAAGQTITFKVALRNRR